MDRYEYEISTHPADTFSRLIYFCSEQGNCTLEGVPAEEPQILVDLLNERGVEGWELIQLLFGKVPRYYVWVTERSSFPAMR